MRGDRAVWVALGALGLAIGAYMLRQSGPSGLPWMPPCFFHRYTGMDCAGCGMTRAAYAALNGEIAKAFRFNPVGMILLPLAMVGVALEAIGWVRGEPLPVRLHFGAKTGWILVVIILSFWILRNIPYWPLTLLAPPSN